MSSLCGREAGTRMAENTRLILFGIAFALFLVHGLFHLWEWLWWPPPHALQALYGPSELGRVVHAVTEALIALALVVAFWKAFKSR